jgi:hypothetical protein
MLRQARITWNRLDDLGIRGWFLERAEIFLFSSVQIDSETHPGSYPVCSRGKAGGDEADHSPPSSAEVKIHGTKLLPPDVFKT